MIILRIIFVILLFIPITLIIISYLYKKQKPLKNLSEEKNLKLISILIPAHNEENYIEKKVENILSLNYPNEKLEIIIGSDGSTDKTLEISKKLQAKYSNVKCIDKKKSGKTGIINSMFEISKGENILITDADSLILTKDALLIAQSLNKDFVTSRISTSELPGNKSYWNLDFLIRSFESKFNKLIVSTGVFMFIKREHFEKLPQNVIADDLFIPMNVLKNGGTTYQSDDIICYVEDERLNTKQYINKKVRIVEGGLQTTFYLGTKLLRKDPLSGLFLISHKILRWYILPILLVNIYLFLGTPFLFLSIFIILLSFLTKKTKIIILDLLIPIYVLFKRKSYENFNGWHK